MLLLVGSKPLDLAFMLSSTGYAGKQKELTRRLVQKYLISPNDTNVALVTYDSPSTELQLNKGIQQNTVLDTLDQMVIKERGDVNQALQYLLTSVFTDKQGTRSGVAKQAIFIVDTVDFDNNVRKEIEKLKSLGIRTMFIKVGDEKDGGDVSPDFDVYFFPEDLEFFDRYVNAIVYITGQGRLLIFNFVKF